MRARDRLALALVAIALAFAALAVGGAPRWAAGISALLGIVSALPYVTSRRTASRPPLLLILLAVAAGLTALQLLPLPRAIAALLAPAKLELVTANAAAFREAEPGWVMASFDPPATLVELAKLLGYLALAYTCARLASMRRGRRALAAVIGGVITFVALVTLVHHGAGATELYGLYQPSIKPHVLGPLIGVNHLASLLAFGVPITLGLALVASGPMRVAWLTSSVILAATTLLTASRGGAIGLVAGIVVAVMLMMVQRRAGPAETHRRVSPALALPAAAVTVCALILLAMLSAGDVYRDFERTTFEELDKPQSKYQVWTKLHHLVEESHWLGVGKGGFEPAFSPHAETGAVTYSHAENSYLQTIVDWGLPGTALLALALFTVARVGVRRWREGPLEAGVLGAIAALAVHELADFSLEMPAVAMVTVAALALLLPARLGAEVAKGSGQPAPRQAVLTRAGLLAAAAVVVAAALSPLGRTARVDAQRIGTGGEARARVERARAALRRHPGDHVIAGRAAEALFAIRDPLGLPDPRALAVIRRAIAMNPYHPELHRLAARMLLRSSRPEQAAAEFATAARWSRDVRPIVGDVLAAFPDPVRAARALPTDANQATRVFEALRGAKRSGLEYTQRVGELHPRNARVQALLAQAALRERRGELAVPAARAAWEVEPVAKHGMLLGAALALAGDRPGAIAALVDAADRTTTSRVSDRCDLLFLLSDLQLQGGDAAGARSTLERAGAVGASQRSLQAAVHRRLAAVEDQLGNRNQAEWERARARELQPP